MKSKSSAPFGLHKVSPPFSLERSGHAMHGVKVAIPSTYSLPQRQYRLHGITDWLYNAATGKLTPDQVGDKVDECAPNNYRAGGGRISFEEAKAQCAKDIHAIVGINDRDADMANSKTALVVAGVLIAGLFLVTRH